MKCVCYRIIVWVILLCAVMPSAFAQESIQAGSTVTQNFSSLGVYPILPAASLPINWKVDKISTVRTVGTYSAAVSSTEFKSGNNMSSTAGNGIYNLGSPDTASADRCVGWISSGSLTKSGNLYLWLQNTGATTITLTISYKVEKYRKGTNAAGYSIQMYYGTDGSTWTSAGSSFLTSFAADAATAGYNPAPGDSAYVSSQPLTGVTIAAGASIYLAWNYSVTSGTTTSYAQSLGVDDISITASDIPPTVATGSASSIGTTGATLNGTANANGGSVPVSFDYGTSTSYGSNAVATQSPISGSSPTAIDATVGSLSVNTLYHYQVKAGSTTFVYGADSSFYTLAATPTAPTVGNSTSSSLDVTISANGNPSTTEFAIHEVSTNQFVQSGGTLSGSPVWQTESSWGTKTVTGLNPSTWYKFEVKAKNGSNVETAYSDTTGASTSISTLPTISLVGTMTQFSTAVGIPSGEQTYQVSGANLTNDIGIKAPTNFEISLTSGSGFTDSLTLTQSGGSVGLTTVYVRYNPVSAGNHSNSIAHSSSGAANMNEAVSGNSIPSVTTTSSLTSFSTALGLPSTEQSFSVEGVRLTSNITVAAPAQFEVSTTSGSGFTSSVDLIPSSGTVGTTTIYVRYNPASAGTHSGDVACSANGATTQNVAVSGNSVPEITCSGLFTGISKQVKGTSSFVSAFTISGQQLSADIAVIAPSHFQVSKTDSTSGFSDTVLFSPSSGVVGLSTFYVRFSPDSAGVHKDSVSIGTVNATTKYIGVWGSCIAEEPTVQSTISFGTISKNSIVVNFTGGNGQRHLVVARLGSPVSTSPIDSVKYTANAAFGSGWSMGSGNYVVYDSTGSTVTVTNLAPLNKYHFACFEFNNDNVPVGSNYMVSTPGADSASTAADPGVLLFEENFDYTASSYLTSHGWTAHSAGGTNPIQITTPGLTSSGYASGNIGNAATISTSGEDLNHTFTSQPTGSTIYYSALVNVASAQTGGYFLHLALSPVSTTFGGCIWAKSDGAGGVQFSVSPSTTAPSSYTGSYSLSTTYLLVVRYTFNSSSQTADLFVNPSLTSALPGTPDATTAVATSGPSNIGGVCLRQGSGSSAPVVAVDGIRVGTSWGVVSGNPTFTVSNDLAAGNYSSIVLSSGTLTAIGNVTVLGDMTLTGGDFALGANTLAIGGSILESGGTFTIIPTSSLTFLEPGPSVSLPTTALNNLTVNRSAGVSMAGDLIINGTLGLSSGAFSIGANTLTVNGGSAYSGGTLTGGLSSNLVIAGTSSTFLVPQVTLNNLTLNRLGGADLVGDVTVANTFALTSGVLFLSSYNLSLGENAVISGTPSTSNMIAATSTGQIRKEFPTSPGSWPVSFTYPVGNFGAVYSPITLSFQSGTTFGVGNYVGVSVSNSKHPQNPSSADYLNRSWSVSQSNVSNISCDVAGLYDIGDVTGYESNIVTGKYNSSTGWLKYSAVDSIAHQIAATGVTSFSDFTGGENRYMDGARLIVKTKVFLEGAWNGVSEMTTTLNADDMLPLSQPYASPWQYAYTWSYSGTESVSSIPNVNVTDWILLELRSSTDASSVVERRAAFISKDGNIVELDGSSSVIFHTAVPGNYYLVIYHRNHLPIMTASAYALSMSSSLYDFTTAQSQAYGTNPMANLGSSGPYAMISGDYDQDGYIVYTSEESAVWNDSNAYTVEGYYPADFDLDGYVVYPSEESMVWNNNGLATWLP